MRLRRREIIELRERISFRSIQPDEPAEFIGVRGHGVAGRDVENTSFDGKDAGGLPHGLEYLLGVEAMSTIGIAYLVNRLVATLEPDECYLNVGCWKGYTFLAGVLQGDGWCVGVDDFSEFGGPRAEFQRNYAPIRHARSRFHEAQFDTFVSSGVPMPVGLYFYDAAHDRASQRTALDAIVPFLSANAVILVDDTNWPDARIPTLDFLTANASDFELVLDLPTAGNGHPTFWNGLMVVQRRQS